MTKVFSLWRFVISVSLAKSGTWATTTDMETRVHLISLHTVKHTDLNATALCFIFGPINLTVGIAE